MPQSPYLGTGLLHGFRGGHYKDVAGCYKREFRIRRWAWLGTKPQPFTFTVSSEPGAFVLDT